MRNRMMVTLAALALAGGTAFSIGGGKIKWGSNHTKALTEAKESGKPVIIYFSSDS